MIKWIILLLFLTGCGPTLFSVGQMSVTTGDVVANGAKYTLLNNKKKEEEN